MAEDGNRRQTSNEGDLETLMHCYQQGDAMAASSLAEILSEKLYRFYAAQVRNRERAQDLTQECWLRIHKSRHTYRPGEPLLPWIYAIARRVQIDVYRKGQRVASHELQQEYVEAISSDARPRPERSRVPKISELLKDLPKQQQEAVLLLKVAGLSLAEVSRATGVSVGAVKQRAHRAYTTLRRLFEGEQ